MGQASDPIYGLGVIGAAVYFLKGSVGLGQGILALLKALVWPAILVYQLLGSLKI